MKTENNIIMTYKENIKSKMRTNRNEIIYVNSKVKTAWPVVDNRRNHVINKKSDISE